MTKTTVNSLDRPANVFVLDVYKPQGRPAYASAVEGRVTYSDYDGRKIESFETMLFGDDRRHAVPLAGNNTAKNRAKALSVLVSELEDRGWIAKGESFNTD